MWPVVIVVQPPGLDCRPRIFDGQELIHVQTFVPEPTVKRLYVSVIHRLSRAREVELDTTLPGPFFQRLRRELCAVIHRQ